MGQGYTVLRRMSDFRRFLAHFSCQLIVHKPPRLVIFFFYSTPLLFMNVQTLMCYHHDVSWNINSDKHLQHRANAKSLLELNSFKLFAFVVIDLK